MLLLQIIAGVAVVWLLVALITLQWMTNKNEVTKSRLKNYQILLDGGYPVIKILVLGSLDASDEDATLAYNDIRKMVELYRIVVMDDREIFFLSLGWPIYWGTYLWVHFKGAPSDRSGHDV